MKHLVICHDHKRGKRCSGGSNFILLSSDAKLDQECGKFEGKKKVRKENIFYKNLESLVIEFVKVEQLSCYWFA